MDPQETRFEKIAYEKWSGRKVHGWLRYELDFKTQRGKHLSIGNLFRVLENHFYYGAFEFPKGSGTWYQGKHEPIITKELFDEARNSIKDHVIKSEGKEFAFTKMIVCGNCGSGITADEKFKKLKSGGINRHVYYRCSRSRDIRCTNPAINETDLMKEFQKIAGQLELNELKISSRIEDEINRFKKLQSMFLGKEGTNNIENIDVRDYVKFVLKEGTMLEKRTTLECFQNNLILEDRLLRLN